MAVDSPNYLVRPDVHPLKGSQAAARTLAAAAAEPAPSSPSAANDAEGLASGDEGEVESEPAPLVPRRGIYIDIEV